MLRLVSLTALVLASLALIACAGYEPPGPPLKRIPLAEQIKLDLPNDVCSATDGQKTIVWSCRPPKPLAPAEKQPSKWTSNPGQA